MKQGAISARGGVSIAAGSVFVTAGVLVALWRASAPELMVVSRAMIAVGAVGLVLMAGVLLGGMWLGRRSDAEGGSGPIGGTPLDPTDSPPEDLDDLDRELQELLSGHWSPQFEPVSTLGRKE